MSRKILEGLGEKIHLDALCCLESVHSPVGFNTLTCSLLFSESYFFTAGFMTGYVIRMAPYDPAREVVLLKIVLSCRGR